LQSSFFDLVNSLSLLTDVVLQDFCDIVGNEAGLHTRVWFRNVFTETIEDKRTCADVAAPLITQATECAFASTSGPAVTVTVAPVSGGTSAVTSSIAFAVIAFVMMA
jgi:hypothetical protein